GLRLALRLPGLRRGAEGPACARPGGGRGEGAGQPAPRRPRAGGPPQPLRPLPGAAGGCHGAMDYMRITFAPLALLAEMRRTMGGADPARSHPVFSHMGGDTYL